MKIEDQMKMHETNLVFTNPANNVYICLKSIGPLIPLLILII